MPTYSFECTECGHKFEFEQAMKDVHRAFCPKCGRDARRTFVSVAGIVFNGKGFYTVDSRKPDKKDVVDEIRSESKSSSSRKQKV